MVSKVFLMVENVVTRVLLMCCVAMWLLECSYCCYVVTKVFLVIARLFCVVVGLLRNFVRVSNGCHGVAKVLCCYSDLKIAK